jgi:Ser/Thr protein kinase RdoA (MazF antagonist)
MWRYNSSGAQPTRALSISAARATSWALPPDLALFLPWLDAVLNAVRAMYKAGVVHLDIYPGNVMWDRKGELPGIAFL